MMGLRVTLALVVASCVLAATGPRACADAANLAISGVVPAALGYADENSSGHAEDETAHSGEAGEGTTEEHAESSGPLAWNEDLAIWTAVIFLVLFGLLYRFAWGPIREGLDKREQRIADNIAAAQRTNEEAKQLLVQYEQKLTESQVEVRAILDEARRDAEHTQREMLAKAATESDAVRERAKREIETATAQALKDLAETSSQLAVDLAGKIIRAELDTRKHSGLIQEAMVRFPKGVASEN